MTDYSHSCVEPPHLGERERLREITLAYPRPDLSRPVLFSSPGGCKISPVRLEYYFTSREEFDMPFACSVFGQLWWGKKVVIAAASQKP
jgi:hypothetical protein